jgi:hypothetical protein
MVPSSNNYEDWSVGGDDGGGGAGHGSDDDRSVGGVPVDIDMIVQAHETDDFWLPPSPTRSAPQFMVNAHTEGNLTVA